MKNISFYLYVCAEMRNFAAKTRRNAEFYQSIGHYYSNSTARKRAEVMMCVYRDGI